MTNLKCFLSPSMEAPVSGTPSDVLISHSAWHAESSALALPAQPHSQPATGSGFLVPPPLPDLEGSPSHLVVSGELRNHQRSEDVIRKSEN